MDQDKRHKHDEEIGKRLSPAFKLLVEFCSEHGISTKRLPQRTPENSGRKIGKDGEEVDAE